MIRGCTKEEFDQYVDFAYEMALDPTKSGYPTYCDGVKTKAMLVERASEAFVRETERMLLFASDGEVQGLIHYYWIPEDHYLDTCLFLINRETERAMEEFLAYARDRFGGYDLFLGFPADNRTATTYLAEHGFECIEQE